MATIEELLKELRIVRNPGAGTLEALDEDGTILDRPLNLKETCTFAFDKHIEAIVGDEQAAREQVTKRTKLDPRHEAQQRLDRLERERAGQRTRFGK